MSQRAKTIPTGANPHDAAVPPSPVPAPIQVGFLVVFWLAVAGAVFFVLSSHWRRGTALLGAAIVWLGVIRPFTDSHRLSILSVRSRKFDAFFDIVIGGLLFYLALSVDALGS